MNMTIEEAIKHCIDIANSVEGSCPLCAEEHLVLAEWLAELGRYKDIGTVEDFQRLVTDNHNLRNELCQKCQRYREAHEGACNGCKWQKEDAANDKCRSNI